MERMEPLFGGRTPPPLEVPNIRGAVENQVSSAYRHCGPAFCSAIPRYWLHCIINSMATNTVTFLVHCLRCSSTAKTSRNRIVGPVYCNPPSTAPCSLLLGSPRMRVLPGLKPAINCYISFIYFFYIFLLNMSSCISSIYFFSKCLIYIYSIYFYLGVWNYKCDSDKTTTG